jgi:hypothetical protein
MGGNVFAADAFARLAKQQNAPAGAIVRGLFAPKLKSIDEANLSIDFVISSAMLDRDNDTINPRGWKLDAYLQNPVVLWAHDQRVPPVARAENTRMDGDLLVSTAIYTPQDLNPFGFMIFRMYVGRFLNAASVGFKPIEYVMRSGSETDWGVDYSSQELLEWSNVGVPSNPQALARAKASGIDTAPMIGWCAKQLEDSTHSEAEKAFLRRLYRAAKGESPIVHHVAPVGKAEMAIFNLVRGELDRRHPSAKAGDTVVFDMMPDLEWTKSDKGLWSAQKKQPPVKAPGDARPLYMSRCVNNAADIHKWMKDQGFKSALKPEDMHVTLAYSRDPVDWSTITPDQSSLKIEGATFACHTLGEKGAVVMSFGHDGLAARHQEIRSAGASWDYADFKPHVTLTYDRGELDPAEISPYTGLLELGPEKMEPLNEGADENAPEAPLDPDNDEDPLADEDDVIDVDAGKTFQTQGGPDSHEHAYGKGDTQTEEAGDPPHMHGVTWGEDGTVTIGDAEAHNHDPDPQSIGKPKEQPANPNPPQQPSDEAIPTRGLEELLRKIVREELDARAVAPAPVKADGEHIIEIEETKRASSSDILDGISAADVAEMIADSASKAVTAVIRRGQGKID